MISAYKAVDRVVAEALGKGGHRVVDLTAQEVLAVVQARDWFCVSIHSFRLRHTAVCVNCTDLA